MASLLIELVKLTPHGYQQLRDRDPREALALLAEADQLVASTTKEADRRRQRGDDNPLRTPNPFDDLEPIRPAQALGIDRDK
jgi:hypothetical protein